MHQNCQLFNFILKSQINPEQGILSACARRKLDIQFNPSNDENLNVKVSANEITESKNIRNKLYLWSSVRHSRKKKRSYKSCFNTKYSNLQKELGRKTKCQT